MEKKWEYRNLVLGICGETPHGLDQDPDVLPVESESEREGGGDERTELLLAATFLLMVILR